MKTPYFQRTFTDTQWRGGRGGGGGGVRGGGREQRPQVRIVLAALKSVIASVKYYTKYVKSGLSRNSKIAGISVAVQLSNSF